MLQYDTVCPGIKRVCVAVRMTNFGKNDTSNPAEGEGFEGVGVRGGEGDRTPDPDTASVVAISL